MGFKASEHDGDDSEPTVGEWSGETPRGMTRGLLEDAQARFDAVARTSASRQRDEARARARAMRNVNEQVEDRARDRLSRPTEENRKTWTYRLAWYGAIVATLALGVAVAGAIMTGIVLSKTPEPTAPPIAPGLEQPSPRPPSVAPAPSTPAPRVEPSLAPPR